jgi:EAL domain-containing protein (putative c-di-GMP-specific phosphodiesterase class I)
VLRSLRRMNCDVAQGFLISKPKPGDEFFKWLRKNSVIRHDLLLEKNSG